MRITRTHALFIQKESYYLTSSQKKFSIDSKGLIMLYDVEKMSHNVSFEQLDSILTFAMGYLDFDTDVPLTISFEVDHDGQSGFIDVDEDEVMLNVNPKLSLTEMTKTIFHELVHAKQIMSGQYDPNDNTWGGVLYTCDYWNLPWEIEAYELESDMFDKYSYVS